MKKKNIPSAEDFSRVAAEEAYRSRGLDEVRKRILSRFHDSGKLHEVVVMYCSETSFLAYIFYCFDRQIEEAKESGMAKEIMKAILDELENVGRGERSTIQLDFEFDSHENVKREYNGSYYNRLL